MLDDVFAVDIEQLLSDFLRIRDVLVAAWVEVFNAVVLTCFKSLFSLILRLCSLALGLVGLPLVTLVLFELTRKEADLPGVVRLTITGCCFLLKLAALIPVATTGLFVFCMQIGRFFSISSSGKGVNELVSVVLCDDCCIEKAGNTFSPYL